MLLDGCPSDSSGASCSEAPLRSDCASPSLHKNPVNSGGLETPSPPSPGTPPAPWPAGPTSGRAGLPARPGLRPLVPAALRPSKAVSRAYLLPSSGPLGSSAELRASLERLRALWGVGDVPQVCPFGVAITLKNGGDVALGGGMFHG